MDVAEIAARWSLTLGDEYPGEHASTVRRAVSPEHGNVALKLTRRDYEAEHEGAGLRFWDGDGVIRVIDEVADDEWIALLLERADPGAVLKTRPEPEQDEVVAALLHRLWRAPPADAPFRPLAEMCARWAAKHDERAVPLDAGIEREGMRLYRLLPSTATRHVVLLTDLHGGNIVSSTREPWLVIDPKPFVGDPTYDALQHMLNCVERLTTQPLELVARMADLLGLDRERLHLWLFARAVQQSDYQVMRDLAVAIAP
jgi:streptomycin 6-kinase